MEVPFLQKKLATKSRGLFLQKSLIVDTWHGPKYASDIRNNLRKQGTSKDKER